MADRNIFSLAEEWSANIDHFLRAPEGDELLKDLQSWERETVVFLAKGFLPLAQDADPVLAQDAKVIKADTNRSCLSKLELRYGASATAEEDVKSDFFYLQTMAEKLAYSVTQSLLTQPTDGAGDNPERPTKRVDPPNHLLTIDDPWQEDTLDGPSESATVPAPPDYDLHTARTLAGRCGLYNLVQRVTPTAAEAEPPTANQVSVRPAIPPPSSVMPREPSPLPVSDVPFESYADEVFSGGDRPTPFLGDLLPGVGQTPVEPEPTPPDPDSDFSEVETVTGETEVDPADLEAWENAEIDQALDDFSVESRVSSSKDGHS